jgi:hypothetical protein
MYIYGPLAPVYAHPLSESHSSLYNVGDRHREVVLDYIPGHELSHKHTRHVHEPMHDRRLMSASEGMLDRRTGAVSSRRIGRVRPLMSVVEGIIAVVSTKESQREEKQRGREEGDDDARARHAIMTRGDPW